MTTGQRRPSVLLTVTIGGPVACNAILRATAVNTPVELGTRP